MPKVIYKTEIGVNMLGQAEYTVLPVCPVCGEWTYGEDTCPFCINKENITKSFTKQELINAGFGGVFDNEMFEVVEAEDD